MTLDSDSRTQTKELQGNCLNHGFLLGHGLDVVDVADFSRLLKYPAKDYLDRYFTKAEMEAVGDGITKIQRLAGRFAVKEAVMKALGTGWGNGIAFTDVEVVTLESGAPTVDLKRKLSELAQALSISRWLVSVSHTSTVAIASVIAIGS